MTCFRIVTPLTDAQLEEWCQYAGVVLSLLAEVRQARDERAEVQRLRQALEHIAKGKRSERPDVGSSLSRPQPTRDTRLPAM